jgi:hypothetical protein
MTYGPNNWFDADGFGDDEFDRDDSSDYDTYFAYDENNYEDREDEYLD